MVLFRDIPIQKKLLRGVILISATKLFIILSVFFVYEFYTFRESTIEKLSTIGKIISTNSTAALAFNSPNDAQEILSALKAEPHIIAACIYDSDGRPFAHYPSDLNINTFPSKIEHDGYHFTRSYLEGFAPILQKNRQLGKLYLKSDLGVMYEQFQLFAILSVLLIGVSFLLAYLLSKILQNSISRPILSLAETAEIISDHGDYSLRAKKLGNDELGSLTDAFNYMLAQIQEKNQTLSEFNQNLEQKILERTTSLEIANVELKSKEEEQAKLVKELQITSVEVERKNELLTGIAEVNNTLRGAKDLKILAQDIINKITPYLDAQVGALYFCDDDDTLSYMAGFAFSRNQHILNKTIKFGEGLVGQTAIEGKLITFKNVPENYIKINSSLGEISPKEIVVLPLLFEDMVKGVIELGSAQGFTSSQLEFLDLISENIAISINSSQIREQTQSLLSRTQQQAEELESQQEEMGQINEALTKQTLILQSSEEELKVQQEELQQANVELEEKAQLLKENNVALEQARQAVIIKAQELERINTYKSEFFANMSHELRTPLNSVLILAKLIADNRESNLTAKQIEYANVIYKSGNDLLSLINDILDLSKIESGKLELVREEITLESITNDIGQIFTPQAIERKLKFNISIEKGVSEVIYSDKQRLVQILRNLLSNAFKFTQKEGSVSLSIFRPPAKTQYSNEHLLHVNEIVAFSVIDTGIGIAKDKQAIIFEAFKQADGSTSRKYGGTGLGLSISKELTGLLGGEISLKSEPGVGSTFTIYIPSEGVDIPFKKKELPKDKEQKTTKADSAISKKAATSDSPSEQKVMLEKLLLIVEDDLNFQKVLATMAESKGYKVITSDNGKDALLKIRNQKPDAIILDMQLPLLDGWSVLKEIKNDNATAHIPVHVMTGMDKEKLAMEMGAVSYLQKPISKEKLDSAFDGIAQNIGASPKRLLIVEDNQDQNMAIRALLDKNIPNAICDSAYSLKETLQKLSKNIYDCIILDLELKDSKGLELFDKLQSSGNKVPPIIVFTGKDLSSEEERMISMKGTTVILKSSRSYERLLDETNLFFNKLEENKIKYPSDIYGNSNKILGDVLNSKTVLLADDDMRNVFALTTALESYGLTVIPAGDGKEAIEKLKTNPSINIVLMDIMMPEMDGYEAMQAIRKMPEYKKLPILALTAKAMQGDREKCLKAGASDYISKPVNTDQLVSLMRVWLYK